jgi:hypothetical protein
VRAKAETRLLDRWLSASGAGGAFGAHRHKFVFDDVAFRAFVRVERHYFASKILISFSDSTNRPKR